MLSRFFRREKRYKREIWQKTTVRAITKIMTKEPVLFPLLPRLPLEEKFKAAAASGQVVLATPRHVPALVRLNPDNRHINIPSSDSARDPAFPPYLSIVTGTERYLLLLNEAGRIAGAATLYPKEEEPNALVIYQLSVHAEERHKGHGGKIINGLTEFFNRIPGLSGVYLSSYEEDGRKYLRQRLRNMARQLPCPVYEYSREISDFIAMRGIHPTTGPGI